MVDVANVMGARPDGWWKDRAGAAARLRDEIAALAARGIEPGRLPAGVPVPGPAGEPPGERRCFPAWVLVLEGRARDAAAGFDRSAGGGVDGSAGGSGIRGTGIQSEDSGSAFRCVPAPGSGDDTIAREAAELSGYRLVVTADRELRRRCERAGASVAGPGWLLGLL